MIATISFRDVASPTSLVVTGSRLNPRLSLWETIGGIGESSDGDSFGEVVVESASKNDIWVERLTGDEPERERAIAELRDLLVRGLNKSLSAKYGTALQVDDVVQDALMKILSSLDKFQGRSRFTTWAMTIAIRTGISQLRRKHFQDVSLDSMTTGNHMVLAAPADEESSSDQIDRQKILQTLKELVETRLTDKQREATQALLDGMPVEEIARRTGSNRNAVYKLIHDARIRLRDGFAEHDITGDEVNAIFA